jgi:hypothetical protein
MTVLLLTLGSLQAAGPATMLKEDESATLFPALGWRDPAGGGWLVECHGWVYEREPRTVSVAVLQKLLEMKLEELNAGEKNIFEERARWFVVDNERAKNLHLILAGEAIDLGRTDANGHVEKLVALPDTASRGHGIPAGTNVTTLKMAGTDKRIIQGRVHLIEEQGWTVVSDIDDTIKTTMVRDRELLVRNTFCREFQPVEGMEDVYAEWAKQGAVFHYVSAGPWQLYPDLETFRAAHGYPAGTFHMRHFRLKDQSGREFLVDSKGYKAEEIGKLLERFPKRRFVLVGDSGEHDPEIYGELARKHPEQVVRVLIRDVTGEAAGAERYHTAFQGLAREKWALFNRPAEVGRLGPVN